MRPRAASRRCFSCIFFPDLVVLHHALQHWPSLLEDICHALEQRNPHNAEEAQLQANRKVVAGNGHMQQQYVADGASLFKPLRC